MKERIHLTIFGDYLMIFFFLVIVISLVIYNSMTIHLVLVYLWKVSEAKHSSCHLYSILFLKFFFELVMNWSLGNFFDRSSISITSIFRVNLLWVQERVNSNANV